MKQSTCVLATLAAMTIAAEAIASGVGGAIYVPARVKQASHMQAIGPHGGCDDCRRLGLACVEHATPAPCDAEGCCTPRRDTFGYAKTRWRTWPGTNYGGPTPQRAADAEASQDVVDPPAPEDEDRQAPPPIEDAVAPAETGPEPIAPAREGGNEVFIAPPIELPPMPRPVAPRPAPAAPATPDDGPPALPFDFGGVVPPAETPTRVDAAPRMLPTVAPRREAGEDGPPPLPAGLTTAEPGVLIRRLPSFTRRLPGLAPRSDMAVQTASAELPSR